MRKGGSFPELLFPKLGEGIRQLGGDDPHARAGLSSVHPDLVERHRSEVVRVVDEVERASNPSRSRARVEQRVVQVEDDVTGTAGADALPHLLQSGLEELLAGYAGGGRHVLHESSAGDEGADPVDAVTASDIEGLADEVHGAPQVGGLGRRFGCGDA